MGLSDKFFLKMQIKRLFGNSCFMQKKVKIIHKRLHNTLQLIESYKMIGPEDSADHKDKNQMPNSAQTIYYLLRNFNLAGREGGANQND